MEEVKVEVSGDMNVPQIQAKPAFDFGSFSSFSKIPSPLEAIQIVRKYVRPWSEFFNTANFKTAASMPRLSSRFVRNLKYFQSNYLFIAIILMVYCLITSPLILIVLGGVLYASHRIRKAQVPVTLFGYQMTTNHQIMAVNVASIPVLILAGAGSALFWTIGASCFVVSGHAIFYNIDAIVTEEADAFGEVV